MNDKAYSKQAKGIVYGVPFYDGGIAYLIDGGDVNEVVSSTICKGTDLYDYNKNPIYEKDRVTVADGIKLPDSYNDAVVTSNGNGYYLKKNEEFVADLTEDIASKIVVTTNTACVETRLVELSVSCEARLNASIEVPKDIPDDELDEYITTHISDISYGSVQYINDVYVDEIEIEEINE